MNNKASPSLFMQFRSLSERLMGVLGRKFTSFLGANKNEAGSFEKAKNLKEGVLWETLNSAIEREDWGLVNAHIDAGGSLSLIAPSKAEMEKPTSLFSMAIERKSINQVLGLLARGYVLSPDDYTAMINVSDDHFKDAGSVLPLPYVMFRNAHSMQNEKERCEKMAVIMISQKADADGLRRLLSGHAELCVYEIISKSVLGSGEQRSAFKLLTGIPLELSIENPSVSWLIDHEFLPKKSLAHDCDVAIKREVALRIMKKEEVSLLMQSPSISKPHPPSPKSTSRPRRLT